jgi:DNA mismatch endonuclease (patch repair protein)
MRRVKAKGSKPELVVRRLLYALGFRFRLHRRDLPGTPDIVFPSRKKAIFVHGCFWHRHANCARTTDPKTRAEYWQAKFAANLERDARQVAALEALGWSILILWECEMGNIEALADRLRNFLNEPAHLAAAEDAGHSPRM